MAFNSSSRVQPLADAVPRLFYRRSAPALVPPQLTETITTPTHDNQALNRSSSGLRNPQESPSSSLLQLSPWQFALVWAVYVTVSLLNAMLALVFAAIYSAAYIIRGGYMIESVGLLPLHNIPIVAGIYATLSLFFWMLTLQSIVGSLRARRLAFKSTTRRRSRETPRLLWLERARQRLAKVSVPFEVVFLSREVLEVATQSYQVYKCSTLISMHWINDFYVATLALNCWIAPIIHVRLHQTKPLQRFIYTCSDVVLDFVSTFVVPVTIISTVVVVAFQENLASASGDMEYAFDVPMNDTAFSNMVKAVQQVFVVTWLDVFVKILPFVSMAMCLNQIQKYVEPRTQVQSTNTRARRSLATVHPPPQSDLIEMRPLPPPVLKAHAVTNYKSCGLRFLRFVISVRTLHVLFAMWGVCLVGFHVRARSVSNGEAAFGSQGCETSPHPWFVEKMSCTVLEINCHRLGFTGQAHEIASALDRVNLAGVGTLIISHCPRLFMPPQIRTLNNLMFLEIFNATLMDWGENAALVNSDLPAMQYLNIIRVNMTELPVGLQSTHFPARLRDITIALSNITTLPTDLHTKWKLMVNLVLERTLIDAIPSTISKMNPSRLSLFNNRITSIPSDFFTRQANFWILSIAKNPVKAWPETIGSLSRIYLVLMDYTEIAELPRWLTDEGERRAKAQQASVTVSAGGSRFCRAWMDRTDTSVRAFAGLKIVCRKKSDEEIEAYMMSFYQAERLP